LNNDQGKESNKQIYKVSGVSSFIQISLKVADTFGVDLTSAKELKNKELQEDLRSLSRL
jgi:hypothetical protein